MTGCDIVMDGLLAAIAGIGFGAISFPPRRVFPYIAILAATGHALRFSLMNGLSMDIASASFCASLSIGLLSLWFGKRSFCPMTVLYIPALLPMIPGMYAYRTVFALVMFMQHLKESAVAEKYMQELLSNAIVTFSTVFLLAVGATIPIFVFPKRAYTMTRRNRPSTQK
ncbi:MAG: threonine/serine exporter family protein [Tannerella sp.]|nr:threonine/serine exporter family protein [Tannerella sp.]